MALTISEEIVTNIKNTERKLEVKSVKTMNQLIQFLDLVTKIFSFPEPLATAIKELYTKYLFSLEMFKTGEIKFFIGFKDSVPIGTATIFYNSGVAGLNNLGILAEYQKQGLGKYFTNFLIKEAFEKGFRTFVLQASPMGYPLYEKLGFKTYYKAKQYNLS